MKQIDNKGWLSMVHLIKGEQNYSHFLGQSVTVHYTIGLISWYY